MFAICANGRAARTMTGRMRWSSQPKPKLGQRRTPYLLTIVAERRMSRIASRNDGVEIASTLTPSTAPHAPARRRRGGDAEEHAQRGREDHGEADEHHAL